MVNREKGPFSSADGPPFKQYPSDSLDLAHMCSPATVQHSVKNWALLDYIWGYIWYTKKHLVRMGQDGMQATPSMTRKVNHPTKVNMPTQKHSQLKVLCFPKSFAEIHYVLKLWGAPYLLGGV